MNYKYSLPELYLLLDPQKAEGEKLYRLTLYSLLIRDVLAIRVESRNVSKFDKIPAKFVFIDQGENYADYQATDFEKYLLELVEHHEEQIRFFIAKCFFHFGDYDQFKDKYFYQALGKENLTEERSWISKLLGINYELTEEGIELKNNIQSVIEKGNDAFQQLSKLSYDQAFGYVLNLAPLFLLSEEVTDHKLFELLKTLEENEVNDSNESESIIHSTIELWADYCSDTKVKKVDFDEIFAMNPHYFETSAILGILGHNSGYSFVK